jgi:cysteine desulfurase / selenocysteine lyase
MTTPTAISEAGVGTSAPLDIASLARLANELFSAPPGGARTIEALGGSDVAAVPATPGAAETTARQAGGASPTASIPAAGTSTAPPTAAGSGIDAFALPFASAASVPRLDAVSTPLSVLPTSGPTHPYYFLAEASAFQRPPAGVAPAALASATPVSIEELVAQSLSLPGEAQLRELLAQLTGSAGARDSSPSEIRSPGFYFLDPLRQGLPDSAPSAAFDSHPLFDVHAVRRDFPILAERVNGRPLIWFDSAATTQKPQAVIDRLAHFYTHENSNVHRAAHELAARATDAYEGARSKVARFLGASSSDEIIFVRGATEGINLVAQSWGRANVGAGDEIVLSHLEHHANIVPWQQLALEKGAKLRVIPVDDSGQVMLEEYRKLLNDRTKLVAISQVSNALGTIIPVAEIVDAAHRAGAKVLIDGAQAVSHMRVNVQALQADFYVFSGHKLFAPTGIGAVFGRRDLLNSMPPWQGGGNMIDDVTFERTTYQKAPARFEAGTGNIADAAGLGAAIDYVERIGLENIGRYEHGLLSYAKQGLQTVPGLQLIGTAREQAGLQSFVLEGYRPEEVGTALNNEGIAVRAGHHCAQPILRRFGVEATVRPSFAFYNTCAEIDVLVGTLHRLVHQVGRTTR